MERRVRTGASFLAQSEKTATFGLGGATSVDSLVVEWPSGQVDRFADVEANQRVSVIEASGTLEAGHDRRRRGEPVGVLGSGFRPVEIAASTRAAFTEPSLRPPGCPTLTA